MVVTLSGGIANVLTLPASVSVPANATSAAFTASTGSIPSDQTATITASLNGFSQPFSISLTAPVLISSVHCAAATLASNTSTQNLDLAARDQLRQQQARPLLETIRQQVEAAREQALPASKLGGAIAYTQGLWERLTRFLEYPELELSNNLAENSMRGVALGRKNWIHIGSPQAGPKVAAILSVMETCRRLDIPVRQYLGAVLPGLADGEHSEIGRTHACRLGCAEPVFCLAIATNHVDGLTLTL